MSTRDDILRHLDRLDAGGADRAWSVRAIELLLRAELQRQAPPAADLTAAREAFEHALKVGAPGIAEAGRAAIVQSALVRLRGR